MTLTELFAAIAAAIRSKDGTTASIPATTFPERILAISGGGGGSGGGNLIARVSVEMLDVSAAATIENYYGFYSFNGVRLPKIPDDAVSGYPYMVIARVENTDRYQLLASKAVWYSDGTNVTNSKSTKEPFLSAAIGATEWTVGTSGNYVFSHATRPLVWSSHDILNGSASATDIYFEGTAAYPIA